MGDAPSTIEDWRHRHNRGDSTACERDRRPRLTDGQELSHEASRSIG